jgi:hypothetical protein
MRKILTAFLAAFLLFPAASAGAGEGAAKEAIIFATFAETGSQLDNIEMMVESIRAFAGAYRAAPIWLYVSEELKEAEGGRLEKLAAAGVETRISVAPEESSWFFFARKVFASAMAEKAAEGRAEVLAWLDDDTIVLAQPDDFILPDGVSLGYRPVMHRNIGQLYGEPIDAFWGRIFEKTGVKAGSFFPVVTPADSDTIMAYINAGCLVVRPGRGLFGKWAETFPVLYGDEVLRRMCEEDFKKRLFIHQAALAAAVLGNLGRGEMLEFSEKVNYPVFFREMFGAKREFNDLTGVVTLRHESFFRKPTPGWREALKGPADRVDWIKDRFGSRTE